MATQPRDLRREDFQIAIICAIRCEYDAVTCAFDEIWEEAGVQLGNAPKDYNKYTVGRLANRNAVLLLLMGMGKVNAAIAAASLRSSYTEIKLVIVAGICGGVPGVGTQRELLLGDVIISRSIVQYDLGRRYTDRFATKDTIEDSLGRPHESVRSLTAFFETILGRDSLQRRTNEILEDIQRRTSQKGNTYQRPAKTEDRLFEPGYIHRHYDSRHCGCSELGACEAALQASCDELQCDLSRLMSRSRLRMSELCDLDGDGTAAHELRVVVGRLGSGDTVMKSGLDRDRIAGEQDLVAFEMEGAGIWDRFPCIVVKAVCDYADSHKNKNYQNFAAARAASATKAILEAFPCTYESKRFSITDLGNSQPVWSPEAGSSTQAVPGHVKENDENDRKLLELLATDHEAHKNFNPRKVPGTCEWFLKDQRYCKWLESTTSSLIWVSAGPGCGKSVLARALIDDERLSITPTKTMVCYFFFKDGDERRTNSCDALSAVLHQLLGQDPTSSLISHARTAFKSYGEKLRNSFYQLWEILVNCAKDPAAGEIVCVLDALDECNKEGRQDIFHVLERFYFEPNAHICSSNLKFLITSRPYDDLEMSFEKIATSESYIRFDGDDKAEDIHHEINLVIDHKVSEFGKDFRQEHRQIIAERLKAMENRTYLWLHLTLGIIDEKRSAYRKLSSVQTLLSRLPSSVFDAYEKILGRSQDEEQARYLLNIILAATRPLTLEEVNYALTLQNTEFTTHAEVEDDMWPREGFKTTLQNLCGLFISVFDEKVSFIHQTAREFLVANPGSLHKWHGSFDPCFAHREISISCIRALSLCSVAIVVDLKERGRPHFMKYAARNWTLHYSSQSDSAKEEFCEAARELCRTAWKETPAWTDWADTSKNDRFNFTDLTLASYFGLVEVVEHIVKKEYVDVNSQGGCLGTAIKAAAAGGHVDVVQSLLHLGASCDIGGGYFATALEAAVCRGHLTVADHLIGRGIPITEDIVIAAARTHVNEEIIAYLFEKHAYPFGITEEIVESAASNSHGGEKIITFFLEKHGGEFVITERVLKHAAANRNDGTRIIELLLERRGHEFRITEDIMSIATTNIELGAEIIALLHAKRQDEFELTEEMLLEAVRGIGMYVEMDLLEQCVITPAIIESAALNPNLEGPETMEWLLERCGDEVMVTAKTVENAAGNALCGDEILQVLLEKRGYEIEITQEVFLAAAGDGAIWMVEFLLDGYEDVLELTGDLLSAAAGNLYYGTEIIHLLFQRYGDELPVTEKAIRIAAKWGKGVKHLALLLEHAGSDLKITEQTLAAAAFNQYSEEPLALLLRERGAGVKITEEVILAAKRNRAHGMKLMSLLREERGDEVELYERNLV